VLGAGYGHSRLEGSFFCMTSVSRPSLVILTMGCQPRRAYKPPVATRGAGLGDQFAQETLAWGHRYPAEQVWKLRKPQTRR